MRVFLLRMLFVGFVFLEPFGGFAAETNRDPSQHWSFKPLQRPAFPSVADRSWPRNGIDYFILARLEQARLRPELPADRSTLLRRLSLDLTGLPPTLDELQEFLRDNSDDAYEKMVDRLLASEHFGEHWARMWLDLARYADTKGYEKDQARPMWRYRDWVIDAFNSDMPYDEFTREQLAGDLLPDPTESRILATAFHRNTMTNDEGGTDDEEFRVLAVKDRIETTAQAWMGLTMGCAKCHSHKYDPITLTDYYRFYALFNQTEDADRGDEAPTVPMPTAEQKQQQERLEAELAKWRKIFWQEIPNELTAVAFAKITAAEKELKALTNSIPKTPILRELPPQKLRVTRVHRRGNFLDLGEVVTPGLPEFFGSFPAGAPTNRLGVAEWLVNPRNPLTARVAANRVWARFFGAGIVETEEDFGAQGTPPTHPELLDWLAVEFRGSLGWSWKKLCKTIVMSATYRQSSRQDPAKLKVDPRNQMLSRGPRFRLSAESIRDQALAASGLLSPKTHGPSVMPPQPDGIWRAVYSGLKWKTSPGPDRYRRALYTFSRRTSPYPSMTTFDAGSGEVCTIRRIRTNTPLQALVTLNDPVFVEAAGALGRRMEGSDLADGIRRGFELVLARDPAPQEQQRLSNLFATAQHDFAKEPNSAKELLESANLQVRAGERREDLAAWTLLANVLLNLDETMTKP